MQELKDVSIWILAGVIITSSFFMRFFWELSGLLSRKLLNLNSFDCKSCDVWSRLTRIEARQQLLRETKIPKIEESLSLLNNKMDNLSEKIDRLSQQIDKITERVEQMGRV